jgi:hypothetical protein
MRAIVSDVEGAAKRLLWALNENQAHDREGAEVEPGKQEVRHPLPLPDLRLQRSTRRFREFHAIRRSPLHRRRSMYRGEH